MSVSDPGGEAARSIEAMRRYTVRRQELDTRLAEALAPVLTDDTTVLDAACGIGHLLPIIRELRPACRYVGVDLEPALIAEASAAAADPHAEFRVADAERLAYGDERFDVAISWKTVSWLEDFAPMLASLMAVTRRHVFLSSMFHDGDIDFHTRVTVHEMARRGQKADHHYNVYSLPRLRAVAAEHGARAVHAEPFEIGIDLPRGDPDAMGTYTELTADGRRLQISGAVLMEWKIIRIDLEEAA